MNITVRFMEILVLGQFTRYVLKRVAMEQKKRTRLCDNPPPQYGGRNCTFIGNYVELEYCNTHNCPIHGNYTHWSEYTPCTESCNNGTQYRTRNCTNPEPKYKGMNCSSLGSPKEVIRCNTHPCPIHGNYSAWSEYGKCSKTCDTGQTVRTRTCTRPQPQYGGLNCTWIGPSTEGLPCNTKACPDIVFNISLKITTQKWYEDYLDKTSRKYATLSNKLEFNLRESFGEDSSVNEFQVFQFRPGSVIADFTIGFLTRSYDGLESLQDALYRDKKLLTMSVVPRHISTRDVPETPPGNVSAVDSSSTSLLVTWSPLQGNTTNGNITGYRISCSTLLNGKRHSRKETFPGDDLSRAEIKGLQKFTEYDVRVAGVNHRGVGLSTDPFYVITGEDVPSKSPSFVSAYNTSSTSIYVQWKRIPKEWVHGILRGYGVSYKPINGQSARETVRVSGLWAEITNLEKYTVYALQVFGFTSQGAGVFTENYLVTTDEDVPSSPPIKVKAHNISSTSLEVEWEHIPESLIHGILLGYNVSYQVYESYDNTWTDITVGPKETSVTIHDLNKFTKYSIQVAGFTQKGEGKISKGVVVSTAEDIPSAAPTNLGGFNTSSTSILFTWSPVPMNLTHGILKGYEILYKSSSGEYKKKIGPKALSTELKHLEKFMQYGIKVAARTAKGLGPYSKIFLVSTDEDVPSKPAISILGRNTSSTSLQIEWKHIPKKHINGILQGYKIEIRRNSESEDETKIYEVPRNILAYNKDGLWKYTLYSVRVFGFTSKGDGEASEEILVRTDEDTPSLPPSNLVVQNKTSPTKLHVQWRPVNDSFYVHGILRGYKVLLKRIGQAGEPLPGNLTIKTLDSNQLELVIEGLEVYTRYELQILAFTDKGDGVPSEHVTADTCNCRQTLHTNWWLNPPYVDKGANNMTGMFPPIVNQIILSCCGNCSEFGEAVVDYARSGDGKSGEKSGPIAVKENIDDMNELSFPVFGHMDETSFLDYYGFIPLVESAGVALVVISDEKDAAARLMLQTLARSWTILFLLVTAVLLSGSVMWILDCYFNPGNFPRTVVDGIWEGFWWAFVTMTTVGYGDRVPRSVLARIFSILWTIVGVIFTAIFAGTVTTMLTSEILDTKVILYGTKVAAIQNSSEYRLGVIKNAKVNTEGDYRNLQEVYKALMSRQVKGALVDTYTVGSRSDLFTSPILRINRILDYSSSYGLVLAGEAKKLQQCFQGYLKEQRAEVFDIINSNIKSIQEPKQTEAEEKASSLFDPNFTVYRDTVKYSILLLIVLVTLGFIYEFWRCCNPNKTPKKELHHDNSVNRAFKIYKQNEQMKKEMTLVVTDFRKRCRQRLEELRVKHRKELVIWSKQKYRNSNGYTPNSRLTTPFTHNFKGHINNHEVNNKDNGPLKSKVSLNGDVDIHEIVRPVKKPSFPTWLRRKEQFEIETSL